VTVAEGEVLAFEARRSRLAAEAAAAERGLAVVEARTAPAREALAVATRRADETRWQRNAAERRLDASGLRGRRAARRELDAAEAREDRSVDYRESIMRHAAPQVDRFNLARERVDETRDALYRYARLRHSLDHVPAVRHHIEALGTSGRWARGDTISIQKLGDAETQLTNVDRRDGHADQFRTLGNAIRDWADHANIELPTADRHDRSSEHAGLEIGL
jgi:hypothetical protein